MGQARRARIDTHHHFYPKPYLDAVGDELAARMPRSVPAWSPEIALDLLDRHHIEKAVISLTAGPQLRDAAGVLRSCNEEAAQLRRRYPGRFGSFASLPLPDMDASLAEVAYSCDVLDADGFIVFTNYGGVYLGDELFVPLWEELDRRGAIVFVHPDRPAFDLPPIAPPAILEFPSDTMRAGAHLLLSGTVRKYERIRFILSHAGGTLPYLLPRLNLWLDMSEEARMKVGDLGEAFRRFYFDTALSGGFASLDALVQVADPTHILFGSDLPIITDSAMAVCDAALDRSELPGLSAHALYRGNAEALLGVTALTLPAC